MVGRRGKRGTLSHMERAKRWAATDLRSYPTLSAEAETEATLAAKPKHEQVKKGKPRQAGE